MILMASHIRIISIILMLAHVNTNGWAVSRLYTVRDGLLNNQGRMVVELPNGQILARTEGGFFLHDGERFQPVPCDESRCVEEVGHQGSMFAVSEDSVIWLRDWQRIYLFDLRTHGFRYDGADIIARSGLPQGWQDATILRDYQGGTWQCTLNEGIRYTPPAFPRARVLGRTEGFPVPVMALALAGDSCIIIGTDTGVYRMEGRFEGNPVVTKLANTGQCINAQTDSQGRVWLSTLNGLYCYAGGHIRRIDTQTPPFKIYPPRFRFCTEMDDGRFLVCFSLNKLMLLDDTGGGFTPISDQYSLNSYRTLVYATSQDDTGDMILCAQNGLLRFTPSRGAARAYFADSVENAAVFAGHSDKVNCILQLPRNPDGSPLWLGTQNGLLAGKRWLTTADDLANNCIRSLTCDGQGRVWVATANGVSCIQLDAGGEVRSIISYDENDGFATEYHERASLMYGEQLLLGGAEGLTVLQPATMRAANFSISPAITRVSTNLQEEVPYKQYAQRHNLTLPHGENFLTFHLTAFNYAQPLHTHYRYRLEGVDADWNYRRGANCATYYTALDYGTYEFVFQATIDGQEWQREERFSVTILPPWWQTWWAWTLYALLTVAILFFFLRLYLRIKRDQMMAEFVKSRKALEQKLDEAKEVPVITDRDEELVRRVQACVEKHIDQSDFNVEALSREVGIDRSNLYRKLQTITGKTPSEFIREIRLARAAELLRSGEYTVEEIAWMTGFNSTRYFRTHFKNRYGCLPSEYHSGSQQ